MVDYSEHRIKLNQLLKQLDRELLKNENDQAKDTCMHIQVEAKLLTNAVLVLGQPQ